MNISNITGSPVGGDDFFDRQWEFEKLQRSVMAGNSVLLTAPRRVGKSSLMLKAIQWFRAEGWIAMDADVQDCDTEATFLEKLIDACREAGVKLPLLDEMAQKAKALKRFLAGSKLGGGGIQMEIGSDGPQDWREAGRLFERILTQLAKGDQRILLGVDELPIFLAKLQKEVNGGARVDLVLRWLRALRLNTPKKITWIICGSVGLDTFVEQHDLVGTINDLTLQRLGPFTEETAVAFLKALGASEQNPLPVWDAVAKAILERVGWPLPYYLQLMFHALRELPPDVRSPGYPSVEDVDSAFTELLSPHCSSYFAHWDTRLDDQLDVAQAATARFLLKQICTSNRGVSRNKLLQLLLGRHPNADPEPLERELGLVLDLLERDGYLHRHRSTYAFRSFLLRDYWKRRFT
jgi:hypothetical protein